MSSNTFSSHHYARVSAADWSDPRRPVKTVRSGEPSPKAASTTERSYLPQPFAANTPQTVAEGGADPTAADGLPQAVLPPDP